MAVTHSPTPWKIAKFTGERIEENYIRIGIFRGDVQIASVENACDEWVDEARANAKFILAAVNTHDALLAALRLIARERSADAARRIARAAIARTEKTK